MPYGLQGLSQRLEKQRGQSPQLDLAKRLVRAGDALNTKLGNELGLHFSYVKARIERNSQEPVDIDTADGRAKNDVKLGDRFRDGRTLDGTQYQESPETRFPVNPYQETGLKGPGAYYFVGPNQAVDFVPFYIVGEGQNQQLAFQGIVRNHDKRADQPALAINGGIVENKDDVIGTIAKEFFEEMLSGSVPLNEEADDIKAEISRRLGERLEKIGDKVKPSLERQADGSVDLRYPEGFIDTQYRQIVTEMKLEKALVEDPDVLTRIEGFIKEKGQVSYAGPVLGDWRNTNNAWMESTVTYVSPLTPKDMERLQIGAGRKYQFVGGDDAASSKIHVINPNFLDRSFASHGPFVMFSAAALAIDFQEQGRELPASVVKQLSEVAAHAEKVTGIGQEHQDEVSRIANGLISATAEMQKKALFAKMVRFAEAKAAAAKENLYSGGIPTLTVQGMLVSMLDNSERKLDDRDSKRVFLSAKSEFLGLEMTPEVISQLKAFGESQDLTQKRHSSYVR